MSHTPTILFNAELLSVADSTRTAMLNTCEDIGTYPSPSDARHIDIYCETNALNNVFLSQTFWGDTYPASVDTSANYAAILAQGLNNLSDQPNAFVFDWNALSSNAKLDLDTLDTAVFNQSSGDVATFVSLDLSSVTQTVSSLLCDISLMGTVFYNHPVDAILNMEEFVVPTITISGILETLQTVNDASLKEYRDDLFNQAYNKYKYDETYQKLALDDGDSFSIPVRFSVTQEVNYDLSGSPASTHSNNMLTFVVGLSEFAVLKQESSSNSLVYMLRFVAVGARSGNVA